MKDWQARTELLIGQNNIQNISEIKIIIAGLGGVGSWACIALARSGVENFIIIDKDKIDPSNINRQAIAFSDNIGQPKVEVMKKHLLAINPNIKVETKLLNIDKDNAKEIAAIDADYLIDAIDTITAKASLIENCHKNGLPIISAMGAGNRLDPTNFEICDISETYNCPLARALRKILRKRGIDSGVKVVFDPSEVKRPKSWPKYQGTDIPRRAAFPPASMIFAPAVSGLYMAYEVINDLIN
jgi:tRNA A37 threonylcarbamoyladenosine dehydratase